MKLIKLLFPVLLTASLALPTTEVLAQKVSMQNTRFEEVDQKGYIMIIAEGQGGGLFGARKQALLEAKRKAFTTLLFEGIPGTSFSRPLVPAPSQERIKAKHADYFEKLMNTDYGNHFIADYEVTGIHKNIKRNSLNKKRKGAEAEYIINYDALRKELENKGILQKFTL